jgi:hypothetical protein
MAASHRFRHTACKCAARSSGSGFDAPAHSQLHSPALPHPIRGMEPHSTVVASDVNRRAAFARPRQMITGNGQADVGIPCRSVSAADRLHAPAGGFAPHRPERTGGTIALCALRADPQAMWDSRLGAQGLPIDLMGPGQPPYSRMHPRKPWPLGHGPWADFNRNIELPPTVAPVPQPLIHRQKWPDGGVSQPGATKGARTGRRPLALPYGRDVD